MGSEEHKAGGKRWFITNQAETGKSDGGSSMKSLLVVEVRAAAMNRGSNTMPIPA